MINLEKGKVVDIIYENKEIQVINVVITDKEAAINFINLTGYCNVGDEVLLNTVGKRMELGTGGYHYVYYNLFSKNKITDIYDKGSGHIIKLKYTPMQFRVKCVEEYDIYKHEFDKKVNLNDKPVLFAMLHSMMIPAACVIKSEEPGTRISCVFVGGGSMNSQFSKILRELKACGIIDHIVTAGECFGGDYEAINIYTAIITAFNVLKSDIAIVCCGPGIAGTGTYYGFSTLEFSGLMHAAKKLGSNPILIPRVSFSDKRKRHLGLSMQSIAVLGCTDVRLNVPVCRDYNIEFIKNQLYYNDLDKNHNYIFLDKVDTIGSIKKFNLEADVMGRGYREDECYFNNCGLAGHYALTETNLYREKYFQKQQESQ